MARFFFIIWQFAAKKIYPMDKFICPSRHKTFPKNCQNLIFLPKWRNFAKFGHTELSVVYSPVLEVDLKVSPEYGEGPPDREEDEEGAGHDMAEEAPHCRFRRWVNEAQCDQIGRFIGLWATF